MVPPSATRIPEASVAHDRAQKDQRSPGVRVPIVDENCEIVAWSTTLPEIKGGSLRHDEAERIVGEFRAAYIVIQDPKLAMRAGAPEGWGQAWRCLAICSEKAFDHRDIDEL